MKRNNNALSTSSFRAGCRRVWRILLRSKSLSSMEAVIVFRNCSSVSNLSDTKTDTWVHSHAKKLEAGCSCSRRLIDETDSLEICAPWDFETKAEPMSWMNRSLMGGLFQHEAIDRCLLRAVDWISSRNKRSSCHGVELQSPIKKQSTFASHLVELRRTLIRSRTCGTTAYCHRH